MKFSRSAVAVLVLAALSTQQAYATNGMNLSGYGPEAHAMGGASMAYDNGTAALMNNPATLGLMEEGHRFDAAIGGLFPAITAKNTTYGNTDSSATAFYMPAVGWANKSGQITYGVGMFSQGGMGTEYGATSFMAAGSNKPVRSEVGVGRIIVPLAYQADKFTVGGSIDYVWAGMDLQMAVPAGTSTTPGTLAQMYADGLLTASGAAAGSLATFMGTSTNVGYFNFSDGSAFTGKAKGTGFAAKLGMTYKVSEQMTVGATYHSQTKLGDLTAGGASLDMITAGGTNTMTGEVKVINFQWPETYGFGMALQASDKLMVVADYKRISWAKVMKNFHMSFTATGLVMDVTLPQNWKDQDVYELGAAYKLNDALTVRAGLNMANNPVPDAYMNALFPAVAKTNVSGGFGYMLDKQSSIDASFAYVPKTSAGSGATKVDFGGSSAQFLYSHRY
ncbi:MAG: outer membrane protein transport protein [Pseudomonadota bacterium]